MQGRVDVTRQTPSAAIAIAVAVASLGCREERAPAPAPSVEVPRAEPTPVAEPPPPSPPSPPEDLRPTWDHSQQAEDPDQLTEAERTRLAQMVEGTSPVPACNEIVRLLRKLAACRQVAPQMRTVLLRGTLTMIDGFEQMAATGQDKELTELCERTVDQFTRVIGTFRC